MSAAWRWIGRSAAVVGVAAGLAVPAAAQALDEGIALFREGKFAEAEARLRQASGPEVNAYLAAALAKQKKYEEAEAPAKAALEANPTHDVAVAALGESLFGQKKYDEAVDRLSAALKAREGIVYAHFWRAQAYDKKGQAARMVADYETFLKLAPKAPEAPVVQALLAGLR